MSTPEVDQALDELRTRYREKFSRELDSLESLLREAVSTGYGRSELEAIRALAHRLMGTSGSYGLLASSDALGRMEARLDDLLAGPAADLPAVWAEVESDLAAARAEASG